jgi:hypothetical protein
MHRGWMDHAVFRNAPYSQRDAWCWLVENAVWKKVRTHVEGGILTLHRGQLAYSLRYLAKAWKWPSDKKVRVFLRHLQDDGMVLFSKCPKTDAGKDAGRTVITICNYDKYQADPEQVDAPPDAPRTHQGRKEEEGKEYLKETPSHEVAGDLNFLDPAAAIFSTGRNLLQQRYGFTDDKARRVLGGLRKDSRDGDLIEALGDLQRHPDIQEPISWLKARLKPKPAYGTKTFYRPGAI